MKKLPLLLALSLAANVALVAIFCINRSGLERLINPASSNPATAASSAPITGGTDASLIAALSAGDTVQLKAANIPDGIVRELIVGRATLRLQQAQQRVDSQQHDPAGRYWAYNPVVSVGSKEARTELSRAQREYADTVRTLGEYGELLAAGPRFDYLPSAKRAQLARIEQDYADMQSEIHGDIEDIPLPSDRAKSKGLYLEKERTIAAALTPEEFEKYQLRSTTTARYVRSVYGRALQTEQDYRKVFALQKIFDDRYSRQNYPGGSSTPASDAARHADDLKLQKEIQAVIGQENLAVLLHEADQEYLALKSVVKRLNLPAVTTDKLFATRDSYALQSQRIIHNAALSPQDRSAQLNKLSVSARANLQRTLGPEGAEVYAQRANWLELLQNGKGFSTNFKDAPDGRAIIGSTVYELNAPINTSGTAPAPLR